MAAPALLEVRGLSVEYRTRDGWARAVDGVSFKIERGETLGVVGESGSGKTTLALALLRALPDNARVAGGAVLLDGADLLTMPDIELRSVRWRRVSTVLQSAMSAFSPVARLSDQFVETAQAHGDVSYQDAVEDAGRLLEALGLERDLLGRYPHQLSGGMRQRAAIALALLCGPDLLIADEPTTGLDAIAQRRVMSALGERQEKGMALLLISHDLGLAMGASDRVSVLYAGRVVETAPRAALLRGPRHPYTAALMHATPSVRGPWRPPRALPGAPPHPAALPRGCSFYPRCPNAREVCRAEAPLLAESAPAHLVACWSPSLREGE
jgi:oligopeptide/dipeptide ABC transporter ATP-binding protein